MSAEDGRSLRGSSQSVAGVDAPSTAARSARRAHGFIIGIGALRRSNNLRIMLVAQLRYHSVPNFLRVLFFTGGSMEFFYWLFIRTIPLVLVFFFSSLAWRKGVNCTYCLSCLLHGLAFIFIYFLFCLFGLMFLYCVFFVTLWEGFAHGLGFLFYLRILPLHVTHYRFLYSNFCLSGMGCFFFRVSEQKGSPG